MKQDVLLTRKIASGSEAMLVSAIVHIKTDNPTVLYYGKAVCQNEEVLDKYRLTHGFRRYTGNIPEVLISTARGRSPRAVLISTEGISLYTSKARGRPRDVYGIIAFQSTGLRECMGKAVLFSAQFH